MAPRARTAGPGAGARPATRPRCWSRKRSVSAWCSGSVGGSNAGPTGPAASADRWPGLSEPGPEPACPMPSPARASLQIYPAGLGVPRPQPRVSRGALAAPAGSLSHHLTGLPHPTAPHHSGTSLWVQEGYLGPRRAQGGDTSVQGRFLSHSPIEACPHLCARRVAQACSCPALGGRDGVGQRHPRCQDQLSNAASTPCGVWGGYSTSQR